MADRNLLLCHLHLANEQAYDTLTLGERHRSRPFAQPLKEPFHGRGKRKSTATFEFGGLQSFQFGQDRTLSGL